MTKNVTDILVIYWEWAEGSPNAGGHFWAAHSVQNDGRISDWPKNNLRPLAAAKITVTEGEGLDLLVGAGRAELTGGRS